jgi:hypothetical protein
MNRLGPPLKIDVVTESPLCPSSRLLPELMAEVGWPYPSVSSRRQVLKGLQAPLGYIAGFHQELAVQRCLVAALVLVGQVLRCHVHQPELDVSKPRFCTQPQQLNSQDTMRKAHYSPKPSWGSYVCRSTCICTYKNLRLHSSCT